MATNTPESNSTILKSRVFVVDDHPILLNGIARMLSQADDLVLCGQATSAIDAISELRTAKADIVSVDISLQGTNGIELVKMIRSEHPKLKILILSMHDENLYALRALKAGASGYVMKRRAAEEYLTALRSILAGKLHVSPELTEQLISKATRGGDQTPSAVEGLSDREVEVLGLIGSSMTTAEIATQLRLSPKTVESHRLKVKQKLHMKTAPELTRFAINWVNDQSNGEP